jgi:hypothetical protein
LQVKASCSPLHRTVGQQVLLQAHQFCKFSHNTLGTLSFPFLLSASNQCTAISLGYTSQEGRRLVAGWPGPAQGWFSRTCALSSWSAWTIACHKVSWIQCKVNSQRWPNKGKVQEARGGPLTD